MQVKENYSLLSWNTFHLQAQARYFAEYDTEDELRELLLRFRGEKMLHIGCGSNLLFTADFDGVVLHSAIRSEKKIGETDNDVFIRVGSGMVMDDFIHDALEHSHYGLENLSYIPGEVGAAAVQNVGAYGVEAKDLIREVEAIRLSDGELRIFSNEECKYGYRDSIFKNELKDQYAITAVVFQLHKAANLKLDYGNIRQELAEIDSPTAWDVRHTVTAIRKQKLPEVSDLGSAGSFFKNPIVSRDQLSKLQKKYPDIPYYNVSDGVKIPAAWLIEQSGMKGKHIGGAQIYQKQPLVIVNTGNAKADDVQRLAKRVVAQVQKQFDIILSPEVNYI